MENKFNEKIKANYTVRYPTSECNEVLSFRPMDQEASFLDPIMFESAIKMS